MSSPPRRATNLAVQGSGFFVVSNPHTEVQESAGKFFTRVGSFIFDKDGYLAKRRETPVTVVYGRDAKHRVTRIEGSYGTAVRARNILRKLIERGESAPDFAAELNAAVFTRQLECEDLW